MGPSPLRFWHGLLNGCVVSVAVQWVIRLHFQESLVLVAGSSAPCSSPISHQVILECGVPVASNPPQSQPNWFTHGPLSTFGHSYGLGASPDIPCGFQSWLLCPLISLGLLDAEHARSSVFHGVAFSCARPAWVCAQCNLFHSPDLLPSSQGARLPTPLSFFTFFLHLFSPFSPCFPLFPLVSRFETFFLCFHFFSFFTLFYTVFSPCFLIVSRLFPLVSPCFPLIFPWFPLDFHFFHCF